jgi:hypothetical protein
MEGKLGLEGGMIELTTFFVFVFDLVVNFWLF